jgi:hypothetical protein
MTSTAMNVVRAAISVFIVVLLAISTAGWIWVGSHQSAAQATASRTVLGIGTLAALLALLALWRR